MQKLLNAIGRKFNLYERIRIVLLFTILTITFAFILVICSKITKIHLAIIMIVSWISWFMWLSIFFPKRRLNFLAIDKKTAYKKMFYSDILMGVSYGVCLMMSPFLYGVLMELSFSMGIRIYVAIFIASIGVFLLYKGFSTIGVSKVGFICEYYPDIDVILKESIYNYIRHPLFFGGALVSVGSSLLFSDSLPCLLSMINILTLPIYDKLETKRLIGVFGKTYLSYSNSVPAFLPKINF